MIYPKKLIINYLNFVIYQITSQNYDKRIYPYISFINLNKQLSKIITLPPKLEI